MACHLPFKYSDFNTTSDNRSKIKTIEAIDQQLSDVGS